MTEETVAGEDNTIAAPQIQYTTKLDGIFNCFMY
jgi:hypothetical protein